MVLVYPPPRAHAGPQLKWQRTAAPRGRTATPAWASVVPPIHRVAGADVHPLSDAQHSRRLLEREDEIRAAFGAIEPAVKEVAALQWQPGFPQLAQGVARQRLGFDIPSHCITDSSLGPLDTGRLYSEFVARTVQAMARRAADLDLADLSEGEPVPALARRWGFHAVDITSCADGRLSGVVNFILRVPPAIVAHRKSFAGSLFDVEESLRNWVEVELRRHREGAPNPAAEPTRYLKIGVYHTSGSSPATEGCAAHGSDEQRAAAALLERMVELSRAVESSHCCGASIATLLIGVDTDSDAIKVHVPDASGAIALDRFVDNAALFETTHGMSRDAAKDAIRAAVARCAEVPSDHGATEGMRWLCGYLLKNNMGQIDYVRRFHGGRYADMGHSELFVVVGDSFDGLQLRNVAYQAQMETVEEGAADLDVGMRILSRLNVARGLPVPVIAHFGFDGRVPGSRRRAEARSRRLAAAVAARYPALSHGGRLHVHPLVQDRTGTGSLDAVDASAPAVALEAHP